MKPDSIRSNVHQRIAGYESMLRVDAEELRKWEADYFLPLVDRLESTRGLAVLSWDDCIADIAARVKGIGDELSAFHKKCCSFDPKDQT